jgi:tripartite-type tricarboxylate transporter receptor subunit TctC
MRLSSSGRLNLNCLPSFPPSPGKKNLLPHAALACIASACIAFATPATAQDYPRKPIRMLVGWPPGGTVDLIGRLVAQILTEKLRQQVVVDNRPGASGTIVDLMVKGAAPDGYVLQTAGSTHATNPSLYAEAKFDPVRDFTPITLVASTPYVLVVEPKMPVKSVAEFVAWAKKQPGAITFGSSGNGSRQHLAAVMLMNTIGVKMVHVPYKGSAPVVADLLGGHVPVIFENVTTVLPHIGSGRIRALATTTEARTPMLPDVPTMLESGFPRFEISGYFGVYGPPKLPLSIVDLIGSTINSALKTPEMRQSLARFGADAVGGTPASFAAFLQRDVDTWSKVIRDAGIVAN